MRGRKKTPTVLQLIKGNPGRRPLNEDEPQPVGDLTEPPADMSEAEKAIWKSAIENAPRGLLRLLDGQLLRLWVEAVATRLAAKQKVVEFGMVVKSPTQGLPMKSPYQSIVDQQTEIIKRLTSELGFSPTSRSRLTLAGGGKKETNRFANNAAKRA